MKGKLKDRVLYVQLENESCVPETQVNVLNKSFKDSPIAQIPPGGYTKNDNYSKISIVWLEWIMEHKKREGVKDFHIIHALNGTEKRIQHTSSTGRRSYGTFAVMDFRKLLSIPIIMKFYLVTVIKILGLFGNSLAVNIMECVCIKGDRKYKHIHPQMRQTADKLYQATLDRQRYIEELGYKYKCMSAFGSVSLRNKYKITQN